LVSKLKYFLSFIFDVKIETTESILNPFLQVVIRNGRLLLNTYNANYSYGSLQDAFRFVFKKIKIEDKKIKDILVLGFGCGSVAALFNGYKNVEITGVEADEKVLALYEKYFIEEITSELILVEAFAEDYVTTITKTYDLIIVDVFIDIEVPSSIKESSFYKPLQNRLNKNGILIFNFIVLNEKEQIEFEKIEDYFKLNYRRVETIEFMKFNKILVAEK
jgi:spermidine synthase